MNRNQDRVTRILHKLALAKAADASLEVFGASSHRYTTNQPISHEAIKYFELKYGFVLPEAYKDYLLHIGDGGAGPFYGIYPLGKGLPDIPVDHPERALLSPCLMSPELSDTEWKSITGRLGLDADFDIQNIELDDQAYEDASQKLFGGILPIGSQGCTYFHCLVISGPYVGRVVNIDTDNCNSPRFAFEPDFLAWYERWLDEVIAGELRKPASWFGYVKGGQESELLTELRGASSTQLRNECLDGLLAKRQLSNTTLLELIALYDSNSDSQLKICWVVTKSNYTLAKPLIANQGNISQLAFFQCLHWYARDKIGEWQDFILSHAKDIDDEETFRFFTYVLEPLAIDKTALLMTFCESENSKIRAHAIYTLGKIKDRQCH